MSQSTKIFATTFRFSLSSRSDGHCTMFPCRRLASLCSMGTFIVHVMLSHRAATRLFEKLMKFSPNLHFN